MSPAVRDETELLTRLRARDEAAFAELVDSCHGRLVQLAMSFVRSRAVAEEVAQETWLAVMNGLDRFEGRSGLRTWIFRILANRAKSRGSRESRCVPFSALGNGDETTLEEHDPSAPAVDPARFQSNGMWSAPPRRWNDAADRLLMNRQGLEQLKRALDSLPQAQRAVVVLRDIEGLASDEVCNVLELSETNQRVLLHRARTKLRTLLEDYIERS